MTRFLNYCCLCIPLRLAAIIIGYLSVLECIVTIIKCFGGINHEMITLVLITPQEPPTQIKCHGLKALCICRGLFNLLMIALCIRLILGITKGIPEFMELWLITYLLVNILDLIFLFTGFIWIGGYYLLFYLLFIVIKLYCLFIVYRYFVLLSIPCDCQGGDECSDPECSDDECPDPECPDHECPDDDTAQSEPDCCRKQRPRHSGSRRPSKEDSQHRHKRSHKHKRRKRDDANKDRKNGTRKCRRQKKGPNDCSDDDRTGSSTDVEV